MGQSDPSDDPLFGFPPLDIRRVDEACKWIADYFFNVQQRQREAWPARRYGSDLQSRLERAGFHVADARRAIATLLLEGKLRRKKPYPATPTVSGEHDQPFQDADIPANDPITDDFHWFDVEPTDALWKLLQQFTDDPTDLSPTNTAPKRRGIKKADYDTMQREAQLAADWKQARNAGTCKADFAKQKGLRVRDLDRLLTRVRKRNSRAD